MSAKQTVGELVYKITGDADNLKTELKKAEDSVGKLDSSMQKGAKTTSTFSDSFKKIATGLGLVYLAKLAMDFGKASLQAFADAQNSAIQYNNAEKNVAGTTKQSVDALNEYILLLEKKTSVDDKTIRQGAQILAQDQISIENQKKLLAGIVDLAVANSKANGGEIDVAGTAKAVGRVISTGDTGVLTRQNVVVDPKTADAIKNTGDQAERTAQIMKILDENAKGAGEALGNSFQGTINRAKDKIEDLQVAVGKGLSVALTVLSNGLSDTIGGFGITADGTNKLGTAFVWLAGLINFVANTLKLLGLGLFSYGNILVQEAKITWGFGKDVIGIFGKVGDAIKSIGSAMVDVLTGKFGKARDDLKAGFDFSGAFNNSQKAMDEAGKSFTNVNDKIVNTTKDMGSNLETMANAGQVYKDVADKQDALAEATASANKATKAQAELTDDAKKSIADLRDKVLDLKNKSDDLAQTLAGKLTDAIKKFVDDTKSIVTDGSKELADIVIKAETDLAQAQKDLIKEQAKSTDDQNADTIQKLKDTIAEKQKILASSAQFQTDLTTKIADLQKQADQATLSSSTETDPSKKAGFDARAQGIIGEISALNGFKDLDKQIADARITAGQDEFKQAEITTFGKLDLATKLFIDETSKLREKEAIAQEVEKSITDFYKTQTALRQKTLDAFATSSIATLKTIGDEAKSALDALNAVRSAGAQIDNPVNPLSSSTPATGSTTANGGGTTNNSKTVNAPITVNATVKDGTDPAQIARDLAWQLSHL